VRSKDEASGALQDSLLEKRSSAAHVQSEVDAEASFVVWEHEKEALQARLSQRRERMFRCVNVSTAAHHRHCAQLKLTAALAPGSHANIRGSGGHVTLRSLAEFLRDVATEAISAAFSLFKNLPSVLLHLVVGQETRVFCVETVRCLRCCDLWCACKGVDAWLQALIAAHVADLSYYDPEGVKTESAFGELKDRAVLGSNQHVVGFFSCAKTDSHCLLM